MYLYVHEVVMHVYCLSKSTFVRNTLIVQTILTGRVHERQGRVRAEIGSQIAQYTPRGQTFKGSLV
jgi:hypothetical protein